MEALLTALGIGLVLSGAADLVTTIAVAAKSHSTAREKAAASAPPAAECAAEEGAETRGTALRDLRVPAPAAFTKVPIFFYHRSTLRR